MARKGRAYLDGKWINGYKPNQSDYSEIFDSFYNIIDDAIGITGPTGPSGSATATYSNATAVPVTIGGIAAGTTFSNVTIQQMFDMLLYPYQLPAFTAFSSGLFGTYEVGHPLTSGTNILSYAVSNSSNIKVQPPNIGYASTSIPGASFGTNPFNLLSSGTFSISIPTLASASTHTTWSITVSGSNTHGANFTSTGNIVFDYRVYWGFNSNTSLTYSNIIALSSSALQTGLASTYTMPSNSTNNYLYFAWPSSFGTPTNIQDLTNSFNVTSDFQNAGTIIDTNQYGISITWQIWRSVNSTSGAGGFQYQFS